MRKWRSKDAAAQIIGLPIFYPTKITLLYVMGVLMCLSLESVRFEVPPWEQHVTTASKG